MNNFLINFKTSYLMFSLIFMILFFYLLMKIISYYKSHKYIKLSLKEFNASPELFLRYLDQYYITNNIYTFSAIILYFSPTIIFFAFFCYNYLGYTLLITPIDFSRFDISLLINLFLFLFLIVMFKSLFDLLFFKEILKAHIFLLTKSFYNNLINYYEKFYLQDFFGKIYLFFDCISKFKIQAKDSDFDYTEIYLYNTIYNNKIILNLSKKCIKYSKKYIVIHYIFKMLNNVFSKLYLYLNFHVFLTKIPFIILFYIVLNDFLNYNIHYTYYALFLLFFIRHNFQFITFLDKKDTVLEYMLAGYFYKNSVSYKIQRALILEKNIYYNKDMTTKSKENNTLLFNLNDLIVYCLNNLNKEKIMEEINCSKLIKAMSFRYMIIIFLIIISIHILLNINNYILSITRINIEIPIIILVCPMIVIIFLSQQIYYLPKDAEGTSFAYFKYNKTYNKIFWVFIIYQSFLLIFLFYRSNIILYPNECIFNGFGIEIIKLYTALEKQEYFCYYLYNQIHLKEPLDAVIIYCSIYTEYADIIQLISAETSLKEIQTTVNMLVDYYAEYYPENKLNYNLPFKDIVITLVFHSFMQNYKNFLH